MAPTLGTTDVDRAVAFYAEAFGFEVAFENGNPRGFVILKRDAAELHLSLARDHQGRVQNVAHLIVSDAGQAHECCLAAGGRIVKRVKDQEFGLRAFVVADPDGSRIDVASRA